MAKEIRIELINDYFIEVDEMNKTFYKPLTPSLRADINDSIEKNLAELRTCKSNVFVNMQIARYEQTKRLINGLPDGYPMPMERN